jgi:methylglutaconyl-CoA hydratase
VSISVAIEDRIGRVTLDRPQAANAFDERMIAALTDAITALGADPGVRVVVLGAAGRHFSAGADLDWMRRTADYAFEKNLADARRLAVLLSTLDTCAKPVVARVQGPAFAGALGLIAACDIAVASDLAQFAVTEVRLGLIPATISPYLVRSMGAPAARRLILTGQRFGAAEAKTLGLVHEVVPAAELDAKVSAIVADLMAASPAALAAAKALIRDVAGRPLDPALVEETARRIAEARASADAREGLAAFFDKRPPRWSP